MEGIDITQFVAGKKIQQLEYQSFRPNSICRNWICTDSEINDLLGEADRLLGSLDAYASFVPNIDYFIKMHVTKEATTSSKIEGTRTAFEEALIELKGVDPERRDDWEEVNNYVEAMHYAQKLQDEMPISSRLIRETHRVLLRGVRGKNKLPGEFRKSQNWIGSSLKHAHFVPPHHTEIDDMMGDLERFIHSELGKDAIKVPHLIKAALIHYQFETIHPFLDGNGRIGRLLIILYLLEKKILTRPTFYISDFFERNRTGYYHHLDKVRQYNDLRAWVRFFLQGVIETAANSITTFKEIIKLRERLAQDILPQLGRSQSKGRALVTEMYKRPIADGKYLADKLDLHASNANRLIQKLVKMDVLREITGYNRNRMYAFSPYIDIFNT